MASAALPNPDQPRLPLRLDDRSREAFMVGEANRAAVAALDAWRDWPGGAMALVGPPGSGKSHLAAVWAQSANTVVLGPDFTLTQARAAMASHNGRLALDDAHRDCDEAALAMLLDTARMEGGALLLTGRGRPLEWPAPTPDLASRLAALPVASLEEPDLELLAQVLRRLARARFIELRPAVAHYLAAQVERSFAQAHALLGALERVLVRPSAPVSHEVARRALAALAGGEGAGSGDEGREEESAVDESR